MLYHAAHNTNITHLDLSWNHIRLKGADAIAKALKVNIPIQENFLFAY